MMEDLQVRRGRREMKTQEMKSRLLLDPKQRIVALQVLARYSEI